MEILWSEFNKQILKAGIEVNANKSISLTIEKTNTRVFKSFKFQ